MNRHERRAAQSQAAKQRQPKVAPPTQKPIADDVKADIAKVVRSLEFITTIKGGTCFFRAAIGWLTLNTLGLEAALMFGGMIYRAGPDPRRDVVAFCGADNQGIFAPGGGVLGHYFNFFDNNVIDFSVGDWSKTTYDEFLPDGMIDEQLGPIQWIAPPSRDFFWDHQSQLTPGIGNGGTPELGKAWYSANNSPLPPVLVEELKTITTIAPPFVERGIDAYSLKLRVEMGEGAVYVDMREEIDAGGIDIII